MILGRTQAGKTIYLSTLYALLWKSTGRLHMRALDGETHEQCMRIKDTMLKERQWPAATKGSRYLDLEVAYNGDSRPLVSLDYPGEVFRKAFVSGARSSDVEELLEHVDQAAGVIALIDPLNIERGATEQVSDDVFGMVKAIERIRSMPGGQHVPVSLVLTKFDARRDLLENAGGPIEFVKTHLTQLVRVAPDLHVFVCSAVQQEPSDNGSVVKADSKAVGVVKPLEHLLQRLEEIDRKKAAEDARQQSIQEQTRVRQKERHSKRREVLLWTIGWMLFACLAIVAGFLTWWAVTR